jgi:hypothetical protein
MSKNVFFDLNHHIQITDFLRNLSENAHRDFSSGRRNPQKDLRRFVSPLFEIVVGGSASDKAVVPADAPEFVSE